MVIIPFDMDNEVRRLPFVTMAIALFCIFVFIWHEREDKVFETSYDKFCSEMKDSSRWLTLRKIENSSGYSLCTMILFKIRMAEDKQSAMMELAKNSETSHVFKDREYEIQYIYEVINEEYERFLNNMPTSTRREWMFYPLNYTISQIFTSSVSHSNTRHLVGNMLFFLVFACTLELLVGHLSIFLFFIFSAIASCLGESYAVYIGFNNNLPSLGLSGVISAAMALLAVLLPWSKISVVIWSGFFVIPIRIPIFLLVGWFIYWDYYYMNYYGSESCIGYVAHLSGAASGILVGLISRLFLHKEIRQRARAVKGL